MTKKIIRAGVVATALAGSLVVIGLCTPRALAQTAMSHSTMSHQETSDQQSELIRIVRESTAKFKSVSVADTEGYKLQFGCVTGPDAGAMGLHFVKMAFVENPPLTPDGKIDPTRPQIVIYEPIPGGGVRLTGADYLLLADPWDQAHPQNPPQLMGQLFHYFPTPNRFGLPAFYTLHVWAWKENPKGAFVNWHPDVSCKSFVGDSN